MAAAVARFSGMGEFSEIAAGILAGFSTTMPDWTEIPFFRNGIRTGSLIAHRTITHWPPIWVFLIFWGFKDQTIIGALAIGAGVGSMWHILGDAPNPMGIPWLLPHRRIRFGQKGWWRSGEHEILMTLFFTVLGYGSWHLAGGPAAYGLTKIGI